MATFGDPTVTFGDSGITFNGSLPPAPQYTWTGADDSDWNNILNWGDGTDGIPGAGNTATFDGAYSVVDCNLSSNDSVGAITINASYTGTLAFGSYDMTVSGTVTVAGGTLDEGSGDHQYDQLVMSGGNIIGTSGTLTLADNGLKVNFTGGTYTANGGQIYTTGNSVTCNFNNQTIHNLRHNNPNDSSAISYGDNFTCHDLWHEKGVPNADGRIVDVTGDYQVGSWDATTKTSMRVRFSGTGDQEFYYNKSGGTSKSCNIVVDKPSGTLYLYDSIKIFTKPGYDAWNLVQGDVDAGTSRIILGGFNPDIDDSNTQFYNVRVDTDTPSQDFHITDELHVTNNFEINDVVSISGGTLVFYNKLTSNDSSVSGTASIKFAGTGTGTFSGSGGGLPDGTFTIDATGTLELARNMNLNGTGQDLVVTNGTLDLAGYDLTVDDTLSLTSGAILRLKGNETITVDAQNINSGSTVEYYDDAVTAVVTDFPGKTFGNLTFGDDKTHEFATGAPNEITVNGVLGSNGSKATPSVLRSVSDASSQWYIDLQGSSSLGNKVNVKYSNADSGIEIRAVGSVDSGNNDNWLFLDFSGSFIGASLLWRKPMPQLDII